jgi:hypothetical protein
LNLFIGIRGKEQHEADCSFDRHTAAVRLLGVCSVGQRGRGPRDGQPGCAEQHAECDDTGTERYDEYAQCNGDHPECDHGNAKCHYGHSGNKHGNAQRVSNDSQRIGNFAGSDLNHSDDAA